MTSSLVGSEMCIRDRGHPGPEPGAITQSRSCDSRSAIRDPPASPSTMACLLYTSDAADDM
eukprot:9497661-Prorocentrum_lima.AAC.1